MPASLDSTDRKILAALQGNARLTNAELAERAGLSATPCWNRVKRLEADGVIESYVAVLNQEKLGYPDTVLIEVTLDRHDDDVLHRFGELLAELPEVLEAYLNTVRAPPPRILYCTPPSESVHSSM